MATHDKHCIDKRRQENENSKEDKIEKPDVVENLLNVDNITEAITLECVTALTWSTLTFLHAWWAAAQTDFCRLKDTPAAAVVRNTHWLWGRQAVW